MPTFIRTRSPGSIAIGALCHLEVARSVKVIPQVKPGNAVDGMAQLKCDPRVGDLVKRTPWTICLFAERSRTASGVGRQSAVRGTWRRTPAPREPFRCRRPCTGGAVEAWMVTQLSLHSFSSAERVDGKLAVIILQDQFESAVPKPSQGEDVFEMGHLERQVLRQVMRIQIRHAVVVMPFDIDLQVTGDAISLEESSKTHALHGDGVVRQSVTRRNPDV